MTTRREVLDTAAVIVEGDRDEKYGTPEDSFTKIAWLWSAYMGFAFAPHDVAAMMMLLKIARIANNAEHVDNWVDIAGYAACGGEIAVVDEK
jgi:hypothetical protein